MSHFGLKALSGNSKRNYHVNPKLYGNNLQDNSCYAFFQVLSNIFVQHFFCLFHHYSDSATIAYMQHIHLMRGLLCFQTAKGYILLFDVLGGGDDKYLYEPVYPR